MWLTVHVQANHEIRLPPAWVGRLVNLVDPVYVDDGNLRKQSA